MSNFNISFTKLRKSLNRMYALTIQLLERDLICLISVSITWPKVYNYK